MTNVKYIKFNKGYAGDCMYEVIFEGRRVGVVWRVTYYGWSRLMSHWMAEDADGNHVASNRRSRAEATEWLLGTLRQTAGSK